MIHDLSGHIQGQLESNPYANMIIQDLTPMIHEPNH